MLNKYKLVIFDWDGTLMDSVERIVSSMQGAAVEADLPIPSIQAVKDIIGLSLEEAGRRLFPLLNEQQGQQLANGYKRHYIEIDDTPTPLFNNAKSLLTLLNQSDKWVTVATGKARAGLDRVMAESDTTHFFHSSRCADECQSKPNPEMILSLLSEFNVSPEDAVMIGDSIHDMEMAKRAGVDRIGVSFGVHDIATLSAYEPIAVINCLSELTQNN